MISYSENKKHTRMKRSARTPMDTHSIRSNAIVKEVIDELVSMVENAVLTKPKKKKNRKKGHRSGKRHREKQARKKAREIANALDLHKPLNTRWHFNKDTTNGRGGEILAKAKEVLEPAGFQLIDFYDTPIWEDTEGKLVPLTSRMEEIDGAFALEIESDKVIPLFIKFLNWMKELPHNVIIYACPTAHNVITSFFQFHTPMDTILSMNFVMWCFKGEDYHFALDGNTPTAFYHAHLKKVLENKPFSTESIECPICCETPTPSHSLGSCGYGGLMPCQTCGQCACEKCIMKYAGDQCKLKIINIEGKIDFRYSTPDHTCPFCRQGFWNPSDKTSVPRTLLKHWRDACRLANGEYSHTSQIEENIQFIRSSLMNMRNQ